MPLPITPVGSGSRHAVLDTGGFALTEACYDAGQKLPSHAHRRPVLTFILHGLVQELLEDVGPAHYERTDLRLSRPVAKAEMTEFLTKQAPAEIGGEKVDEVSQRDGIKYIMRDDSWLLIRPSGTEPVLRVYAEGRSNEMVKALLGYGEQVAKSVV